MSEYKSLRRMYAAADAMCSYPERPAPRDATTTIDDHDYVGNIKRRSQRCQCDRDLSHGTCSGPDNCPYSDRDEEDEIRFLASVRP